MLLTYNMYMQGINFNKTNKKMVKLTNKQDLHRKIKYKNGLITDVNRLIENETCNNGLYFCDYDDFIYWLDYNNNEIEYMWDVEIPDDALVYSYGNKFKTSKFILNNKQKIDELSIFEDDVFLTKMCKLYDSSRMIRKYKKKEKLIKFFLNKTPNAIQHCDQWDEYSDNFIEEIYNKYIENNENLDDFDYIPYNFWLKISKNRKRNAFFKASIKCPKKLEKYFNNDKIKELLDENDIDTITDNMIDNDWETLQYLKYPDYRKCVRAIKKNYKAIDFIENDSFYKFIVPEQIKLIYNTLEKNLDYKNTLVTRFGNVRCNTAHEIVNIKKYPYL